MNSRKEMKDEEEEAWEMKAVACDCNSSIKRGVIIDAAQKVVHCLGVGSVEFYLRRMLVTFS